MEWPLTKNKTIKISTWHQLSSHQWQIYPRECENLNNTQTSNYQQLHKNIISHQDTQYLCFLKFCTTYDDYTKLIENYDNTLLCKWEIKFATRKEKEKWKQIKREKLKSESLTIEFIELKKKNSIFAELNCYLHQPYKTSADLTIVHCSSLCHPPPFHSSQSTL